VKTFDELTNEVRAAHADDPMGDPAYDMLFQAQQHLAKVQLCLEQQQKRNGLVTVQAQHYGQYKTLEHDLTMAMRVFQRQGRMLDVCRTAFMTLVQAQSYDAS